MHLNHLPTLYLTANFFVLMKTQNVSLWCNPSPWSGKLPWPVNEVEIGLRTLSSLHLFILSAYLPQLNSTCTWWLMNYIPVYDTHLGIGISNDVLGQRLYLIDFKWISLIRHIYFSWSHVSLTVTISNPVKQKMLVHIIQSTSNSLQFYIKCSSYP